MKKAVQLFLITIAFFAVAQTAHASSAVSECQTIYGGGEVCPPAAKFTLDKKVQNPQTGVFVDSIGMNDAKYKATQTVNFQITIQNTGSSTLENVEITDQMPSYLTFSSGPGSFNAANNTLTIKLSKLEALKSQTFTVAAKVVDESKLPQDKSVTCVVNEARAVESKGTNAKDSSQVCIEKTTNTTTGKGGPVVQPPVKVTSTPQTGPEMFSLIALIPTGAAGLILRRKSK